MNNINKLSGVLVIAFGILCQCFANQYDLDLHQFETADNYYVQPGDVDVAPDGIFILLEKELIQVDTLCSDARGIFVPYKEMSRRFVRCPFCQRWYDPEHEERHKCSGAPD